MAVHFAVYKPFGAHAAKLADGRNRHVVRSPDFGLALSARFLSRLASAMSQFGEFCGAAECASLL
jgi:hypothetical protein